MEPRLLTQLHFPPLSTTFLEAPLATNTLLQNEHELLEQLSEMFLAAGESLRANNIDSAEDTLREIIRLEPRLAEPQLSLARVMLDSNRLPSAEEHTRIALRNLDETGIWTEDVAENVVRAIAHAQLAEILRRTADEDDVIFGDPERFKALLRESQEHYQKAATLDPSDDTASYYAFFMGPPTQGG